jgi:hypothetical protein
MDTLLMAITGAALAMALAMGVVLARMLREERRRSEARVAALVEMSGGAVVVTPAAVPSPVIPTPAIPTAPMAAAPDAPADLVLRPDDAPADDEARLFVEPERSSPWTARLAAAAAFVSVVGTLGYLLLPARQGETAIEIRKAPEREPAPAAAAPPLELLALRHAADGTTLSVSGVVHNPRAASARTGVVATLFAFGADGALLATGRAPLDYTTLGPGDESPFVVTVPVSGAVARYRVGFRGVDGTVIAHIDRRPLGEAVARR